MSAVCPCGSAVEYDACCGRWHAGAPAPEGESLMRSRYCAFVRRDAEYLLATWHPSTRPTTVTFQPGLQWLGLRIVDVSVSAPDAAQVEFIARLRIGSSRSQHHERSRFVREAGFWLYVDGTLR